MSRTCLWTSVVSLVLFVTSRAAAQVERVWLTHPTNDPSRLVDSWATKKAGERNVRCGPTRGDGQDARAPGSRALHHVGIPLPKPGAVLHSTVSPAGKDDNGFLVHEVRSPYQAGRTQIRVLLPDRLEKGKRYPVVYVLPVEAGREGRYGDGLLEVKKRGLHNKYRAIFVAPTFSHLPWYADHPTRADIRQEAYLLKVVLPEVEKTYPALPGSGGRLLLGFSKSGWGAFSLLLRHPGVFGKAAAWDAPLMLDRPGRYGSGDIFATRENFEGYRITKLLEARAEQLRNGKRLILLGYGNFRDDHRKAHALMDRLKIPHESRDGPARKHDWHSGWVAEAAELLLAAAKEGKSP